jgi:hypothetical protein
VNRLAGYAFAPPTGFVIGQTFSGALPAIEWIHRLGESSRVGPRQSSLLLTLPPYGLHLFIAYDAAH